MRSRAVLLATGFALLASTSAAAAQRVTSPQQQFGHQIGADYELPDYTAFMAYWEKLARESDRMVLDTIGLSEEGRPQLMAIITSPENHRNLERYREMARRLALAENLTDEQARQMAREAKAVVWIDGGLHATEVLGAQQLMETVYQLVSGTDDETMRFLNDLIILAVHANPDGMELVSDWYTRNPVREDRSTGGIPRLYQKYVGHDNNRDFYASTQSETENMNREMYINWHPVIMYNHHQTGPPGTVMFSPPFRDPPNYYFDPAILTGLEIVGGSMHDRFIAENKPGVTTRSGASYSTWWNGGLRTTAYFHNIIGLLTETIGNPTPFDVSFMPARLQPRSDLPLPLEPQRWHFRTSIDYSVTANKAVLDIASKRRVDFLYNRYLMAKRAIEAGNKDTWTDTPRRIEAATAAISGRRGGAAEGGGGGGGRRGGASGTREDFMRLLRDPAMRNPRGYILPADQPDFPTAAKLVEALAETGVQIHRATREFQVAGRTYAAGSFVVRSAQPFRSHVIDMFEPQDHPDDIPYPGGAPTPPYDVAGYTLAMQMGVQYDRILDAFDGPFEVVPGPKIPAPAGRVIGQGNAGYMLSHQPNDAFIALNRLIKANKNVFWLNDEVTANGKTYPAGTFFIQSGGGVRQIVDELAAQKGLTFEMVSARPRASAQRMRQVRIGLFDRYGGMMPSGWVRWILEQFEFPYEVVYPQALDAGDLNEDFDVLVFVSGSIPGARGGGGGRGGGFGGGEQDTTLIPAEYHERLGSLSAATIPHLRTFIENGGTVITIGSSANLAEHLGLALDNALVETVGGQVRPLPEEKYYIPGSVLRVRVDTSRPIAHGFNQSVDVFFDDSPVWKLGAEADTQGLRRVAWYDSARPLRSGWALGQEYLENGLAAVEASVGRGHLYMFGPEITFRAQPHGTFKFLFNGIYLSSAQAANLR
jgi:hypothetical protein